VVEVDDDAAAAAAADDDDNDDDEAVNTNTYTHNNAAISPVTEDR
jgi:hypothetical protein